MAGMAATVRTPRAVQASGRQRHHEATKDTKDTKAPGLKTSCLRALRVFVMNRRRRVAESALRLDLLGGNSCVVVLQRADADALLRAARGWR